MSDHPNIQLLHGDCFELMRDIPDHSIDFILTDPPYLFNRGGGLYEGTDTANSIGGKSDLYKFGNKMMGEMADFDKDKIYRLLDESKRVLKVMRGYYFCNETALQYYLSWATDNGYKYNILVLKKPAFVMNRNRYATNCEFIVRIIAKSGAGLKILDYTHPANSITWLYSIQQFKTIKNKLHPAEKPQDILEGIIRLNTDAGDTILDPFMGSGTVGLVCKKTDRKYVGMELDKKYYDIAQTRITNATSQYRLF